MTDTARDTAMPAEIAKLVEAVAHAWASIDGHADEFDREKGGGLEYDDPAFTGHYEGYMAEAQELLKRSGLATALEALSAENERLRKALSNLLAPFADDECRKDHHGYCQAHFLEEDCCVAAARRALEGVKEDG